MHEFGLEAGNARRDGEKLFDLIEAAMTMERGSNLQPDMKIRTAIFGGSGYGGSELLRILLFHPEAEITLVTANEHAGKACLDVHRTCLA